MIHEAVIVDVDGTLAEFNPSEVHQWVLGVEKDWDPFFEHMRNAPAITNVLKLVKLLKAQGQHIVICSGRPDSHREATIEWLKQQDVPFDAVYLRPNNTDHLADEVVKDQLLKAMHNDGYQPWLVLDDRTAVVDHWRAMGLTCLQCAPGDF
jgi:phosphoglycolate phosphatase-like HAD superfamily hydrolase